MSRPTRACELKFLWTENESETHGSRPTRACELKLEVMQTMTDLNIVTPHAGV